MFPPKQQKLSLKNRALRFLSLREHSRLELGRKLARYAEEGEDVEVLLDFLEEKRLLSCERFSESLIRRRSESYGNQRILAELQTHGLDTQLLEQSKAELEESEVARACAVWQKKFGRYAVTLQDDSADGAPPDGAETLSQEQRAKQIRYLMQRGFSGKAIKVALRGNFDDSGDLE
jgi:regulatory protein